MVNIGDGSWPHRLADEAELDDWMTRPSEPLVEYMRTMPSPLVVLGAGGKMGPSLCVLARRAAEEAGIGLDVVAVSRFTDPEVRAWLEARGIRTHGADLLDAAAVASLPDAGAIVYLVGLKFGTQQAPASTWAVNTLVPAAVVQRYAGRPIVALSTGNVYPLVPVAEGGSTEDDALTPLGEYANAAVARERIFEYASTRWPTPGVLVRLNYAVDLRYGVLVDLAQQILDGEPVDVTMGHVNVIWQRDANDMILRALELAETPMRALNLTGPDVLSVRGLAERLGEHLGRPVTIVGEEAETALLNDPSKAVSALGAPPTPLDVVLRWTADWVQRGRPTLGKPTHFETRDGRY